MTVDSSAILKTITDFIAAKRGEATPITMETPLLRDGYLDSFQLVELIVEVEKQLGVPIPEGFLIPDDFETPEVLCQRLADL